MDVDWGAYLYGAHYAAYLDHLMHCNDCGPMRCAVGADLCARYLASPDTHTAASSGPVPGAGAEEPR
ncbi:hypothetical protein GCM10010330_77820 [Streptomyces tendae]|uniref:hypothetical protein n=1 Tax=Streptomyces tendae TaxID=1932 RepID=UPI00167A1D3F|nr:hypothetical protein [Streptomyces tendae]GHB12160.1 hypothetical protein GCM10010330_77820 [Streptomyces tendae]